MADWFVRFINRSGGNVVGEYSLLHPEVEVRNSEPGGFSGELALGQKRRGSTTLGITRDQFAPYETNYEVWRQSSGSGVCISDGMLTSINLNFNRDTVLLAGKDWKHYLQRRIYPFKPEDYITYNDEERDMLWDKWPKQWPDDPRLDPHPDITEIVRDILLSMRTGKPVDSRTSPRPTVRADGVPAFTWNLSDTGITIPSYKIYPGDQTTIYDHITKISEMKEGFEWDILPQSLQFVMWSPKKYEFDWPSYRWFPSEFEVNGALVEFDWTNDGPDGTYLIGLGSGRHKVGATWAPQKNIDAYGRHELVYDYGEVQSRAMILQKLKDQNDAWAQKRLSLAILNPEFTEPNFYTGGRPRSLIADCIHVSHFFTPLHTVTALFQVNAIKWSVDSSTNETVSFDLMQIYEPDTGSSGGGFESQ